LDDIYMKNGDYYMNLPHEAKW